MVTPASDVQPIAANFLNTAYTKVGGWRRRFPWSPSSKGDGFGTLYEKDSRTVRVFVGRLYLRDTTAAVFEINRQLSEAVRKDRRRFYRAQRRKKALATG